MRKTLKKNLAFAFSFTLSVFCGAGFFTAFSTPKITSRADTQPLLDELILPSSYKQYLALSSPKDVAVNANYTAIADGNIIYLYDEQTQTYNEYTHEAHGTDSSKNIITQLQFNEFGTLYFTDDFTSDNLYALDPQTLGAPTRIEEVACQAFALYGESLYFTNSQGTLYYAPLTDTQNAQDIIGGVSSFCLDGDDLYAVRSEFYLHKLHAPTQKIPDSDIASTSVATLLGSVKSLAVQNNAIAYTTVAGDFYYHPVTSGALEPEQIIKDLGAFARLSYYDGYAYAVQDKSVRQFDLENKTFTDFEITASSKQTNRLQNATDILEVGETLYLLDNGNSRIVAFDSKTNAVKTSFNATLPATYASSDGETLLTANHDGVALYSLSPENFGALLASFNNFETQIKGVASVYGRHYIACEGYAYTLTFTKETGDWLCEGKEKTAFYPTLFAGDIYGDLYALINGSIFRYSESELVNPDAHGTRVCACDLPADKLLIDYRRNVYALVENAVYKLGETNERTDFSAPLVYTPQTHATSFAFGVEENAVYLLFDGNYLVKSARLNLPTVKSVAVENADERIFAQASAQFEVLQTRENALFIKFDLQKTQGAEFFPYLSYERKTQTVTALKIDETTAYNLLAVFDKSAHKYDTYLVLKEFCTTLPAEQYRQTYEASKTGYLTNAVALYKFPYLTSLLTAGTLDRGAELSLLGEVEKLDHDYYQVAFTQADGTQITGYIPKSYITSFNGAPLPKEETVYGVTQSDTDARWRFVYLALGLGAICILIDYLLLRKKKDDERDGRDAS